MPKKHQQDNKVVSSKNNNNNNNNNGDDDDDDGGGDDGNRQHHRVILGEASTMIIGVAWDTSGLKGGDDDDDADMDLSCVMVDADGIIIDRIFWSRLENANGSVQHTGDNETGEGEGDDESIHVELSKLPSSYHALLFFVSKYSKGALRLAHNVSIRVVERRYSTATTRGSQETLLSRGGGLHNYFASDEGSSLCFCALLRTNNRSAWCIAELAHSLVADSALDPMFQEMAPELLRVAENGGVVTTTPKKSAPVPNNRSAAAAPAASSEMRHRGSQPALSPDLLGHRRQLSGTTSSLASSAKSAPPTPMNPDQLSMSRQDTEVAAVVEERSFWIYVLLALFIFAIPIFFAI